MFLSFTNLAYTPAAQHLNVNCTGDKYFIQDTFDGPNNTKLSCKFTSDMLQNCSGIADPTFGFPEGKPCFIIKMNRVSTASDCREEIISREPPGLLILIWGAALQPAAPRASLCFVQDRQMTMLFLRHPQSCYRNSETSPPPLGK